MRFNVVSQVMQGPEQIVDAILRVHRTDVAENRLPAVRAARWSGSMSLTRARSGPLRTMNTRSGAAP